MAEGGIELDLALQHPGFALELALRLPGRGVSMLFGPSGCGKTTCLRALAGLLREPGARVQVNGELWQEGRRFVPPHRRAVGYVFQEASLFPHLDVRANIEYGQRRVPLLQKSPHGGLQRDLLWSEDRVA